MIQIIIAVCMLLGSSHSAFVDTLTKCAIKDNDCLKHLFQKIIMEYSSTGVPEYDIPPFDPFKIKDITVPVLGLLNITVEEAEGVGIKGCVIDNLNCETEKGIIKIELTCDIVAKGKFLVSGTNPIADNLFEGKRIHGDGNGEIKADKLHLDITFFYDLIKKESGEIYVSPHLKQTEISYDMQNFHVTANKIFIEEEDVSEKIVSYINKNWKTMLKLFGKTIFEAILDHLHDILNKILNSVPISKVISDDLTPYVKN